MESPAVPVHLRSWMCAVGGIARAADVGEPVHTLLDRVAEELGRLQMTGSFECFVGRSVVYVEERVDHLQLPRRRRVRCTGSRAVGRGGRMMAPGAINAAVDDALAPLGVQVTELPTTPDRLRAAIRAAGESSRPVR